MLVRSLSQVLDEPVTRMNPAEALSQIRLDGRVLRVRKEEARPSNQTRQQSRHWPSRLTVCAHVEVAIPHIETAGSVPGRSPRPLKPRPGGESPADLGAVTRRPALLARPYDGPLFGGEVAGGGRAGGSDPGSGPDRDLGDLAVEAPNDQPLRVGGKAQETDRPVVEESLTVGTPRRHIP